MKCIIIILIIIIQIYIIYKVISTNKNENITIYNCEIISSNNQYYLLGETFTMKEGYSYIAENSKQLTDELKVELL